MKLRVPNGTSPHPPKTLQSATSRNGTLFCWRFPYPESTPCAVISLKTKHCPYSQAGRRGLPDQSEVIDWRSGCDDDHQEAKLRAEPPSFGTPEESHGPGRNPRPNSRRFRAPLEK